MSELIVFCLPVQLSSVSFLVCLCLMMRVVILDRQLKAALWKAYTRLVMTMWNAAGLPLPLQARQEHEAEHVANRKAELRKRLRLAAKAEVRSCTAAVRIYPPRHIFFVRLSATPLTCLVVGYRPRLRNYKNNWRPPLKRPPSSGMRSKTSR
eukprot:SAG31_NODE_2408_length_5758_cov_10.495847_2_plen_152_part_00